MKLESSRHILKKTQILSFVKMRSVQAELFHADGQTNRNYDAKAEIAF